MIISVVILVTKRFGSLWSTVKEIAGFSAVGCVNVVIDFLIFIFCLKILKLPTYQAQLMGVTFGLSSSYILNHIFTFHSEKPFFSFELLKFSILSLICIPCSSMAINYLDTHVELDTWLSKLIVTVVVGMFNYVMSHMFVFRSIRERKPVRALMKKIYQFNALIRWNRMAQVAFIAIFSVGVDLCMYIYLSYVGLDSYKSQPLCVVGGLVCCYLMSMKFLPYKIEHFVGFFCVSAFTVMICSPIMYLFEMRFGLNALLAKIPATFCISALVFALCRLIVYRDVFEDDTKKKK